MNQQVTLGDPATWFSLFPKKMKNTPRADWLASHPAVV